MPKDNSPIRGRWCDTCRGRGWHHRSGDVLIECPQCHWVGFVGVTSEQVRQAEIDATRPQENADV